MEKIRDGLVYYCLRVRVDVAIWIRVIYIFLFHPFLPSGWRLFIHETVTLGGVLKISFIIMFFSS